MEFDEDSQAFVLNKDDLWAMGHPKEPFEAKIPLPQTDSLLTRAGNMLELNEQIDPSEFPQSARRAQLLGDQYCRDNILRKIIAKALEHKPDTVADELETWLKDNS